MGVMTIDLSGGRSGHARFGGRPQRGRNRVNAELQTKSGRQISLPLDSIGDSASFWAHRRPDLPDDFVFWRFDFAESPPFTAIYCFADGGACARPLLTCGSFQTGKQSAEREIIYGLDRVSPYPTADGLVRFGSCKKARKNGFVRFRPVYAADKKVETQSENRPLSKITPPPSRLSRRYCIRSACCAGCGC